MRVFVDMDGTLAKWQEIEYEEKLLEKGYYRNLPPNQKLVDVINGFIDKNYDIYILSCVLKNSKYAEQEKREWLSEYLPNLSEDKWIFVPYGENKAEYLKENYSPITMNDYLIDDYTKNLNEWKEFGGTGVKFLNGINHTHGTWQGLITQSSANELNYYLQVGTIINDKFYYSPSKILDFLNTHSIGDNEVNKNYFKLRYPFVSQCADYEALFSALDITMLDLFEREIYMYENDLLQEPYSDIVNWYEGAIDTKDLLNELQVNRDESKAIDNESEMDKEME